MAIPDQLEQFRVNQTATRHMFEILVEDCKEHLDALQNDPRQIHRRAYVRAVFAFIEGLIYCQKMSTLNLGVVFGKVTLHDLVALEDVNLEINSKGDVKTRPAFPKFLNNLKFTFKVYSKSIGSDFQLSLGGIGWECLQNAVKIRDRLMHPKDPGELIVTNDEILITQDAFKWFYLSYSLCGLYAEKAMCLKSDNVDRIESIDEQIAQIGANLK